MFIAIFASAWDKLALVNTGTSRTARRLSRGLTAIAVALFMTPAALAAGGGHDTGGDDPLLPVVAVLIAVALAYLGTHSLVEHLHKRFLFVSGIEYILLGVLLGPMVPGVHAFEDMSQLGPLIALGVGWVGLVYGMDLDVRDLVESRDQSVWLGTIDASVTLAVVGGCSYCLLYTSPSPRDQRGSRMPSSA